MNNLKYFSVLLIIFIINFTAYSQFGWQKIYSDDTALGIHSMNAFKISGLAKKQIYIIRGINFNPNGNPNNSGKSLKYNNSNGTWYQPANGFLNATWCFCTCPYTCNPPRWACLSVIQYVVSALDTNMLLKNLMGGCGCDAGDVNYITTNGGISSTNLTQFGNGFMGPLCFGFDIDPVNDQIIYLGYPIIASTYKCVFKSTNRGSTWFPIDTNSGFGIGIIKINPLKRTNIFAGSYGSLLRSTNSGIDFLPVGGPYFYKMSFNNSDSIIFALGNNTIYKSTNHGLNWSSVLSGQLRSVEVSPDNPNIVYAGSTAGLYRSTNGGQSWFLYNDSFTPSKIVIGISKDVSSADTVYAATTDAVYKVYGGWVGINIISSEIPVKFMLEQNFPNPFNPTTKIRFHVPLQNYVELKIYDVSGREVKIIVSENIGPGIYEVSFDASKLPSGVYFYNLTADGIVIDSKKMVVNK